MAADESRVTIAEQIQAKRRYCVMACWDDLAAEYVAVQTALSELKESTGDATECAVLLVRAATRLKHVDDCFYERLEQRVASRQ